MLAGCAHVAPSVRAPLWTEAPEPFVVPEVEPGDLAPGSCTEAQPLSVGSVAPCSGVLLSAEAVDLLLRRSLLADGLVVELRETEAQRLSDRLYAQEQADALVALLEVARQAQAHAFGGGLGLGLGLGGGACAAVGAVVSR